MKFTKYILIILVVFASCKSTKKVVSSTNGIKNLSAKQVAKKHVSSNFNKNTIDAKLKVNYKDSEENIGFSVRMKIKKDEVIYLKGSKIITVFKAKITPEKVSFYSPYKKNYFEGDFSMLKKILGTEINFEQLQNMLLGQSLLNPIKEKQELLITDKSYQLSPRNQPNLFDIFFQINSQHFKLNKQFLVNSFKNERLDISYPKYLQKDGVLFPKEMVINAKNDSKSTNINIQTNSVVFNTDLRINFRIPSGYKEIKL